MESKSLSVPDGLDGVRLDVGIAKLLGFSRSFATGVIESGGVTIDGDRAPKSARLRGGAWLTVSWSPQAAAQIIPVEIPGLVVVHDDDDVVVINKPPGVAAHPSLGWSGPTVLGALAAGGFRISTSGVAERAGIVQRLDVGTSGLMVVAKSERAYSVLKQAFRDREVHKVYHAVVHGHPDPLTGTIEAPIGRHPHSDWKFAVTAGGRPSTTHYETLEGFRGASLLEIHLETGRTHQIRVHMSAQRHPCIGDLLYGADPVLAKKLNLERQWLHAVELSFLHPVTGVRLTLTADYPADLSHALDEFRE